MATQQHPADAENAAQKIQGAAPKRCGRPATTPRWSRPSSCRSGRGSSRRAASAPAMRVLDVGAGTGNASIAAAEGRGRG